MPSYSSGVHMPKKPSLPSSSITSRGKCLVRSHSAANGSIFSRANSRASSTTCSRTSVAVGIESLHRFPAELHHLIHTFGGCDSILHAENGLVDHRHQYAIRNEPRRVIHFDRRLSQLLYGFHGSFYGVVRRLLSTYYLDEFHDGHRIHEVHAYDAVGALRLLGDFGDRYRRSVGREDRAFGSQTVQLLEDVELGVGIFGRSLDHERGILHGIKRSVRLDPAEHIYRQLMTDDAFLLQALHVLLDRCEPAGECILRNINQRYGPPMLRKDVCDPVPHRSGSHHRHLAHATATFSVSTDG